MIVLSPTWKPGVGNIGSIFLGLIFSFDFMNFQTIRPVKRDYLSPVSLSLWETVLPSSWINGWVEKPSKDEKERWKSK
jgi:hypothetical protein